VTNGDAMNELHLNIRYLAQRSDEAQGTLNSPRGLLSGGRPQIADVVPPHGAPPEVFIAFIHARHPLQILIASSSILYVRLVAGRDQCRSTRAVPTHRDSSLSAQKDAQHGAYWRLINAESA